MFISFVHFFSYYRYSFVNFHNHPLKTYFLKKRSCTCTHSPPPHFVTKFIYGVLEYYTFLFFFVIKSVTFLIFSFLSMLRCNFFKSRLNLQFAHIFLLPLLFFKYFFTSSSLIYIGSVII